MVGGGGVPEGGGGKSSGDEGLAVLIGLDDWFCKSASNASKKEKQ